MLGSSESLGSASRPLDTLAVVLEEPESLRVDRVRLVDPGAADVVVDVEWSGISTGTERLLWSGRMPPFPGLAYPLVPGYESVGRVVVAGPESGRREGERVFVGGARCHVGVHGLFGGASRRLVVPGARATPLPEAIGEDGVLLALAATALHALHAPHARLPELIVGHGVLGRLLARAAVAAGGTPVVWEKNPARAAGAVGYAVLDPDADAKRDYGSIYDVSGDAGILDALVARLAPGGEIVLAGFYAERPSFAFPAAFVKEARLRVAAEWKPEDLAAARAQVAGGALSLAGLVTHRAVATCAPDAYRTAFTDGACLKMVLDWRACA